MRSVEGLDSAQCRASYTVEYVNTMQTKDLQGLYIQSPKLNRLNLLTEVAADASITQAELANRCSLSVAMVNNYMKAFCNNGFIEYKRKSVKTVSYYLTSSGTLQMEMLQTELIDEMVGMYINAKEQILTRIVNQSDSALQQVFVYGSGHLAQLAFHAMEMSDIHVLGVCDDDPKMMGKNLCGREVVHPSQIRFAGPGAVIIADTVKTEEILGKLNFLLKHGIKLIRLDKGLDSKWTAQAQSRMHRLKTVRKQHPVVNVRTGEADK
jgi:predicted transcriptional regulator